MNRQQQCDRASMQTTCTEVNQASICLHNWKEIFCLMMNMCSNTNGVVWAQARAHHSRIIETFLHLPLHLSVHDPLEICNRARNHAQMHWQI